MAMHSGLSASNAMTSVLPGSSGAASSHQGVSHGATSHGTPSQWTSPSTSTLRPSRAGSSRGDMLGANNPQQDSGDYAAVGQGQGGRGAQHIGDGHKRMDEFADPREKHGYDSYNSRLMNENSPATKAARVGGDDMNPSFSSDADCSRYSSGKLRGKKGGGIEEVLQACSNSGSGGGGGGNFPADQQYKSPFERRREKEIRRLSRKLTEMEEDKVDKESHLQEMKEKAIVEELLVAETGLRLKLQVAEEQVADQHAYLLQLKHLQADPDLIT
ncbi:hypothetical protein EGW08_015257, partial [Elysia chlorotica]